jgi:hypothetical protein
MMSKLRAAQRVVAEGSFLAPGFQAFDPLDQVIGLGDLRNGRKCTGKCSRLIGWQRTAHRCSIQAATGEDRSI